MRFTLQKVSNIMEQLLEKNLIHAYKQGTRDQRIHTLNEVQKWLYGLSNPPIDPESLHQFRVEMEDLDGEV